MVEVPGGSFIMGSSDEDIIDAQNDITRTMTVRTFYMDETEITNREYMQFIEWVKDSIVRTKLAEKAVYVALGVTQENTKDFKDLEQTWSEFNDLAESLVDENSDGVGEIKMPNLDDLSDENENFTSPEDFYTAEKGEILTYFPAIANYVGVEESDGDAGEEFSRLNGYQLLLRYRAENPIVMWLRDRNKPDSLYHNYLP